MSSKIIRIDPVTGEVHIACYAQDLMDIIRIDQGGIATWASCSWDHDLALEIWQEVRDRNFQTFRRPIHKPMRRLSGYQDLNEIRPGGLLAQDRELWRLLPSGRKE